MNTSKVSCQMNENVNGMAIEKLAKIFTSVLSSIDLIKPFVASASKAGGAFPEFTGDLKSIESACDLFIELVEHERTKINQLIESGDLSEDHLKEARHDMRAKVGAVLGYSELIQEELADDNAQDSDAYVEILSSIVGHAKALIPIIDGLRLDGLVDTYSTNETKNDDEPAGGYESSRSYGEQYADSTVLIIDDSAYNREILSRRLSKYGVKVLTADNGAKGLEVLSQNSVDLILLDVMMPVMDGYEVLSHLKADLANKNIPVLMISALSEVDSIVRCIEAGAEDYLPTPFNPVVLHARIKACLEKKILRDREQENIAKLEIERQKLETAIESIDDGFAVFDKEHRIGIYNKPFQRLYPGVEKLGLSGFTYEELLSENKRLGVYFEERRHFDQNLIDAGENEDWVQLNSARQQSEDPYLIRLHDGRWIEVVNSLTPDGGQVSVHKDVTNRKEDEDRLTYLALHDPLTGLANRASFDANFQSSFEKNAEAKGRFAIMFLDLDGFKNINDTLGHDVGDQVLIHVSEVLKKCVRAGDVVARLGGDEFCLILNSPGSKKDLSKIADRILVSIGNHYMYKDTRIAFGVSIGISCYPEDGSSPEKLLTSSDTAMYAAKKSGKGKYMFFSDIEKSCDNSDDDTLYSI